MDLDRLIRSFDKAADSYDDYAIVQKQCGRDLLDMIPSVKDLQILELGTGTGNMIAPLLKMQPSEYTGVDISEKMLQVARKRCSKNAIKQTFHCCDIMNFLAENNNTYDLIYSNATLQWIADKPALFQQINKHMTSDGTFAFTLFSPKTFFELKNVLADYFPEKPALAADQFDSIEKVQQQLAASFDIVQTQRQIYLRRYDSIRELFQMMKKTGIQGNFRSDIRFTRKTLKEIELEYIRRYAFLKVEYHITFFFCKRRKKTL